jgi:hypothetical protein
MMETARYILRLVGQGSGLLLFGALCGIIVGLSKSPIVAPLVAGGLVLAERIVQSYIAAKTNAATTLQPLIPKDAFAWFFPACLGAIIGILGGIYIRANDALSHPRDIRQALRARGFTADQATRIMDRATLGEDVAVLNEIDDSSASALLSSQSHSTVGQRDVVCEAARRIAVQRGQPDDVVLNDLERSGSEELKKQIQAIRGNDQKMTPEQILHKLLTP